MEEQQTQQTSPVLTLQLNVEQINAVLGALGKMPTETGVWPLMRVINDQASAQLQEMQSQQSAEETTAQ
jgi:hypothetical protein